MQQHTFYLIGDFAGQPWGDVVGIWYEASDSLPLVLTGNPDHATAYLVVAKESEQALDAIQRFYPAGRGASSVEASRPLIWISDHDGELHEYRTLGDAIDALSEDGDGAEGEDESEIVLADWTRRDIRIEFKTLLGREPADEELARVIERIDAGAERVNDFVIDAIQSAIREAGR
ncbi:MAG TPA: hypothetical protein VJ793_23420 [Anaerolineae bacterium]|nr:hypothetical protein [Anaerolineae bacterium]